ncbi:MFS transporter [Brevibacterium sp. 2SA]|uniref:MFS transporter n=1 Tax=Brevibacterium sp. 2SA TaxID=2502198 RepID=UPI0010F4913A|nr:MFS transporter [Brevibacterium sp. 2SA]
MTDSATAPLSFRRRWTVMVICAFALFLVGLDTTIVTVGLAEIGSGVDLDAARLPWVVDAYTVVFASLLMTSGAVADRFGRRLVLLTGLSIFAVASLLCALAGDGAMLIGLRAIQGVGASMLSPVALAIVVNVMPTQRERALAIGVWGAMFGVSMAAGPIAGGLLLAAFDWRALFWINGPVVAVIIVFVALIVPPSRSPSPRRLDVPGQLLLIALLATVVGLLIEGNAIGWTSVTALVGYGLAVLLAVVFVVVENRVRSPLVEPSSFRSPAFAGAILGAVAIFIAFSVTLLLTTSMIQVVEERSALAAGTAILPMAIATAVFAPVSGILVGRFGARGPLLLSAGLITAGGVVLLIATQAVLSGGRGVGSAGIDPLLLGLALGLIGSGIGFGNAPITNAAVSHLPPDRAGAAGGVASTARQLGTSIGIAVAGGLIAGVPAAAFMVTARTGWFVVVACGLALLVPVIGTLLPSPGPPRRP